MTGDNGAPKAGDDSSRVTCGHLTAPEKETGALVPFGSRVGAQGGDSQALICDGRRAGFQGPETLGAVPVSASAIRSLHRARNNKIRQQRWSDKAHGWAGFHDLIRSREKSEGQTGG